MKQKTLQEQYNLIKEGKGNAEVFMKAAKKQFPNFVRNAATLNETISSLKHNHIISENMFGVGMVTTGKSNPDWFKIFNENMEMVAEEAKAVEKEANILGIDFGISETDKGILFRFKNKEAANAKIREIGSNKIVGFIQNSLDRAYGEGSYFFKGGNHSEFSNGYLFQKNQSNINLDKLKLESFLTEEAKAVEKKVSKEVEELEKKNFDYKDKKNIDNVYGEAFLEGYYTEMKDPKNADKTVDELVEIVAKNLAKDRLYYVKDGQFGEKGVGYTDELPGLKASKTDKMEKVPMNEGRINLLDIVEGYSEFQRDDKGSKGVTAKDKGEQDAYGAGVKKGEKIEKKKLKKESTDSKLAEIEKNGKIATLEMQIEALEEIIESKNQRISMVTEDESLAELVDKKKMKEMQREVKDLEKKKMKMEKLYEKMSGKKYAKKEVVGEVDSRFKEMQKEPHDHKWVQIDKDGTQECKICGLRRSNS